MVSPFSSPYAYTRIHIMQRTQIHPEIAQEMLASATNAADKGQSQFFTPIPFARDLAAALPKYRPVITDLACGAGNLLYGSANANTKTLLGSDIDPCRKRYKDLDAFFETEKTVAPLDRMAYDMTLLYPLLREIEFRADLFVLNPPWRLFWHRERLEELADSDVHAVRAAFSGIESEAPRGYN